jgi:hypothetical protein
MTRIAHGRMYACFFFFASMHASLVPVSLRVRLTLPCCQRVRNQISETMILLGIVRMGERARGAGGGRGVTLWQGAVLLPLRRNFENSGTLNVTRSSSVFCRSEVPPQLHEKCRGTEVTHVFTAV